MRTNRYLPKNIGTRGCFEGKTQNLFVKKTELACGKWWSYDVTAQVLEAGSVVYHDAGYGVNGEPARGKTELPTWMPT
jgi:hypothetical protein